VEQIAEGAVNRLELCDNRTPAVEFGKLLHRHLVVHAGSVIALPVTPE